MREVRSYFCGVLLLLACMPAFAVPIVGAGYTVSLFTSGLGATAGMRAGADGNLYVADYSGGRVLSVDSTGTKTVLATGISFVTDVARTDSGRLFATSATGGNSAVVEILSGGATSTFATGFSFPTSVAAFGNTLYVANSGAGSISQVGMDAIAHTIVFGMSAPNGPFGLAVDAAGNLYFIDHGTGGVYKYDISGTLTQVSSVTSLGGTFIGVGFDGDLFFSDVNLGALYRLRADGTRELFASGFAAKGSPPVIGPQGIAYFGGSDLFVADGDSIWKISAPVAVPEPSALLLMHGALAMLVVARPRRRNYREG